MILPADITFRGFEPEAGLEKKIRGEAAKLERYYDGITKCSVVVEEEGGRREGKLYHVRIDLAVPEGELVVRHEPTLHAAARDEGEQRQEKHQEPGAEHKDPARAVRDAFALARRRVQDYARKQRGDVKSRAGEPVAAKVVQLLPDENHGFCVGEDGRLIYFHRNSVLDGAFDLLRVGTAIRIVEEAGDRGPQASTVRLARRRRQREVAARVMPMPVRKAAQKKADRDR